MVCDNFSMSSVLAFRRHFADPSRPSNLLLEEYGLVVDPNDGNYRFRSDGDRDVSIATVLLEGARSGVLCSRSDHLLVWITGGNASVRAAGADMTLALVPGEPVLLASKTSYHFRSDCRGVGVLRLSDKVLRRQARHAGVTRAVPLQLASQPRSVPARNELCAAVRLASAELRDEWVGARERRALNQRLAEVVLDVFLPIAAKTASPTSTAQRAAEWIRANAQAPISLADIADAVQLSPRRLQGVVRQEFGQTPTDLLRNARLQGARQSLLEAGIGDRVGDIAHLWQFRHLGRFAMHYAEVFGESPSITLRSRSREAS